MTRSAPSVARQVKFTSDHVLVVECSSEELQERRQWNTESKSLRRKNKAQIREERERARRGKQQVVCLEPSSSDDAERDGAESSKTKRRKNQMNLTIQAKETP